MSYTALTLGSAGGSFTGADLHGIRVFPQALAKVEVKEEK
jgi:hypothetical protein